MLLGLKRCLVQQSFFPNPIVGVFFNPYFIARRALNKGIARLATYFTGGTLLDVGCGIKPYEPLFKVNRYLGLEIVGGGHSDEAKSADAFYDGLRFPIKSCSIEYVISTQVLEHVFEQGLFINEIHRVLKPGGQLLLTVPFVWDEHECPYDYCRYTSFGIEFFLSNHGFEVKELHKSTTYLETIFQMLSAYIAEVFMNKNKYLRFLVTALICSIIQSAGIILSRILPARDRLYLDNIVFAVKGENQ